MHENMNCDNTHYSWSLPLNFRSRIFYLDSFQFVNLQIWNFTKIIVVGFCLFVCLFFKHLFRAVFLPFSKLWRIVQRNGLNLTSINRLSSTGYYSLLVASCAIKCLCVSAIKLAKAIFYRKFICISFVDSKLTKVVLQLEIFENRTKRLSSKWCL